MSKFIITLITLLFITSCEQGQSDYTSSARGSKYEYIHHSSGHQAYMALKGETVDKIINEALDKRFKGVNVIQVEAPNNLVEENAALKQEVIRLARQLEQYQTTIKILTKEK